MKLALLRSRRKQLHERAQYHLANHDDGRYESMNSVRCKLALSIRLLLASSASRPHPKERPPSKILRHKPNIRTTTRRIPPTRPTPQPKKQLHHPMPPITNQPAPKLVTRTPDTLRRTRPLQSRIVDKETRHRVSVAADARVDFDGLPDGVEGFVGHHFEAPGEGVAEVEEGVGDLGGAGVGLGNCLVCGVEAGAEIVSLVSREWEGWALSPLVCLYVQAVDSLGAVGCEGHVAEACADVVALTGREVRAGGGGLGGLVQVEVVEAVLAWWVAFDFCNQLIHLCGVQ